MQRKRALRSSGHSLLAGIYAARLDIAWLKQFLFELANCRDEKLEALRDKYEPTLTLPYSTNELANYRDELRLLWHPAQGIPHNEFKAFESWRKVSPTAQPGEMICNRWLLRSKAGFLVRWEQDRRELLPGPEDLPATLVYGCLFFGDRLLYCQNAKCGAPWFIGTRQGQQYCSAECAWPSKKAAKLRWWRENKAKKLIVPQRKYARRRHAR